MAEQISSLKTDIKYKDTPIGKIPVDWEIIRFKDIVEKFYNGGTPDTENKHYWDGNIPWVTGADFENQRIKQIRKYITSEGLKNSSTNLVQKGKLLVVTRTGVGKIAIAPFDIAISQDITGIMIDAEKASTEFVYWYLDHHLTHLKTVIQGTSISGLLREDLESFFLTLPPLPEQKVISEILTTVDDALEKTAQIIEKTKEAKKGLMQRLLTRGIGHQKFKKTEIGEIPEEWEVKRLGDLCLGRPEYGANMSAIDRDEHLPRYVRITDVTEDGKLSATTWQSIKQEAAGPYILDKGDFLFARSGATVGKTYLYMEKDGLCAFAGYMIRFRPNPALLLPEFLFHYTHSAIYYNWIKNILRAGAQPNINGQEYANMPIIKPVISEQRQIVDILNSLAEDIEKETSHKEYLESLKKGLMQVLLTGKVRAKL